MSDLDVKYEIAKKYIEEGDVLLFKGVSFVGRWIKWANRGRYSHVGMASWSGRILECVEFREWRGGRTVNLETQVKEHPGEIDVYRPSKYFPRYSAKEINGHIEVLRETIHYNGRNATNVMRELTGLPYGWYRVLLLSRHHIPLIRFFTDPVFEDKSDNGKVFPVCSTAVASALRKTFVDPIPNLSDYEVSPSDLAKSPILNYIMTLHP